MPITTYPITGKTTIANTLTLNIGLNNNGRNVAQLLQYFRTKAGARTKKARTKDSITKKKRSRKEKTGHSSIAIKCD